MTDIELRKILIDFMLVENQELYNELDTKGELESFISTRIELAKEERERSIKAYSPFVDLDTEFALVLGIRKVKLDYDTYFPTETVEYRGKEIWRVNLHPNGKKEYLSRIR